MLSTVYCYRPSSVVCRSVCHTSEPCKNCWTDRDAVWVEDLSGPREPCIRWGPDTHGKGQFWGGKGHPIVKYTDTLWSNGWTDWDAVWIEGLNGLKESCVRWGCRSRHENGQFWWKGSPIVKHKDFLSWFMQKQLNRSICRLGCELERAKGTSSAIFAGGANVPRWEDTLAPPGERDWTVCLQQQCNAVLCQITLTTCYLGYWHWTAGISGATPLPRESDGVSRKVRQLGWDSASGSSQCFDTGD